MNRSNSTELKDIVDLENGESTQAVSHRSTTKSKKSHRRNATKRPTETVKDEIVVAVGENSPPPADTKSVASPTIGLSASRSVLSRLPRPQVPVFLQFDSLTYSVPVKNEKGKQVDKVILKNVSGKVKPGEFLAIMGPTGSGKTTLLSVLSRRVRQGVTGSIKINDKAPTKDFKRQMALVSQDDILFDNLTVEQTLWYTALLRLGNLSTIEQRERLELILDVLNLNKSRNTKIGGSSKRGVSGGERKRANIGNELLTQPSLLFLDEPTSGLDTSTSINLMQALKGLADSGLTIVASIHQPSTQVFNLFDTLLLLVDGATVFYGKSKHAVRYFASIGLKCEKYFNPADFMMGLILQEEVENKGGSKMKEKLYLDWENHTQGKNLSVVEPNDQELFEECASKQKEHGTPSYTTSFFEQLGILTRRAFIQRSAIAFDKLEYIQTIFVAIVAGLIWFQVPLTNTSAPDRLGALYFLIMYSSFFDPAFKALLQFPPERDVIKRERASADLPFMFLQPSILVVISYWMCGLRVDFGAFMFFWLTILINTFTSSAMGLMASCLTSPNFKRSIVALSVICLTYMISGGYFASNIPVWISWLQYISNMSYTFYACAVNEFQGVTLARQGNSTLPTSGDEILSDLHVFFDNQWYYLLVLLGYGILYHFGAFGALMFSMRQRK